MHKHLSFFNLKKVVLFGLECIGYSFAYCFEIQMAYPIHDNRIEILSLIYIYIKKTKLYYKIKLDP